MIRVRHTIACGVFVLLIASCATQPIPHANDAPGFLMGLGHGFLIFFSLIGSLFWDIRIYAFPNNGGWYDLGFFLGAGTWAGIISIR
jgi:hypothetical protein